MKYFAIFMLLISISIQAVEITTGEGINIKANSTVADFENEITTYKGNVVVTQANLSFSAESIEEHRVNRQLEKLVAVGNPTVFINKIAANGELSKGTANKLVYVAEEAKIYLTEYKLEDSAGNTQSSKDGIFLLDR